VRDRPDIVHRVLGRYLTVALGDDRIDTAARLAVRLLDEGTRPEDVVTAAFPQGIAGERISLASEWLQQVSVGLLDVGLTKAARPFGVALARAAEGADPRAVADEIERTGAVTQALEAWRRDLEARLHQRREHNVVWRSIDAATSKWRSGGERP
jgi:hypothetical protein